MSEAAPRIMKVKYILHDRDRHGNERWYFRRRGERVRLPGGPDHPEFRRAYYDALQGQRSYAASPEAKPRKRAVWKPGGFVYFLCVGERVKIGFSKRPLSRLETLKTALSQPVTSFVFICGTQRHERALHKLFENRSAAGEWFRMSPMLRRFIAYAAANGRLPEEMPEVAEDEA